MRQYRGMPGGARPIVVHFIVPSNKQQARAWIGLYLTSHFNRLATGRRDVHAAKYVGEKNDAYIARNYAKHFDDNVHT